MTTRLPSPDELLSEAGNATHPAPKTWEEDFDQRRAAEIAWQTHDAAPDEAARANVLARERGIPAAIIRGNLPAYEAQKRGMVASEMARRYPAIGRWASDKRNAEIAADDFEAIGDLARVVRSRTVRDQKDFVKDAGFFDRMGDLFNRAIYSLDEGAASFRGALQDWSANNPLPWTSEENLAAAREKAARDRALARVYGDVADTTIANATEWSDVKARPSLGTVGGFVLDQGVGSIPGMAMAGLGLPLYIASQAGSIGKTRAENDGREDATISDVGVALPAATASAVLDRIGLEAIFGAPGKKVVTRIAQAAAAEGATEFAQSIVEYAGGTVGTKKGFDPATALEQGVAGAVAGAGMGGGLRGGVEIVAPPIRSAFRRFQQADQAITDANVMDKAVEAAKAARISGRDPEAFAALLQELAGDNDIANAYLPAEAVQAYMQSDGYDGAFDGFRDAVDEGIATGGDVVVPFETAVAAFSKSPAAWTALKDDVRLSAGGMSRREAQTFDEAMADVMAEMTDRFAEQEAQSRAEQGPRDAMLQSLTDKLMNAGFTPNTARQQAELLTQRESTRAVRMGREFTGTELDDLEIRQVLPERLAAAQKADDLDVLIGTMQNKPVKAKRGPSLTEWIRQRGGIEDRGGDLAAMGVGPLKGVSRKGQMKLLREYIPGQASMLGADSQVNSNSPDELAMRAWEAGYFPEFAERPSVNDLLEAIAEAVAGRDRFAEPATNEATDATRAAAEDLRQLLDGMGVDPATASAREIKDALARYAAEQAAGPGFEQVDTKSEAFKRWFGDSKVVDANGEPMVVYHGTAADFDQFSKAADAKHIELPGFFFTPDPSIAERFAASASRREFRDDDGYIAGYEGAAVVPVYLSIKNPVEINLTDAETGKMTRESEVRENLVAAQKAGHDGAIIRGWADGSGDAQYVAFSPTQIKSVNNRGTFNPADPRILYQSLNDGPRGRISFPGGYGTGKTVIEMFQARDNSTFLHETGHLWLEELRFDASDPNAPDQLKADWQAVQDWFAANGHPVTDGAIPVDAHEMWARGVERFIMEGKSPVPALRRLFENFKSWLVSIYRTVDRLKSPITDDIRDVMARLIATDEELTAAREEQSLQAAFTEKPDTMSDAEWAEYRTLASDARDSARGKLLDKTMATVKRRVTKEYKEREASVRAEVAAEIDARPEFRALAAAKASPIDANWITERYGADAVQLMPAFRVKKGGANPDEVAERVGYGTGDEVVKALMGLETRRRELKEGGDERSVREGLIQDETRSRMFAMYGDPFTDGSIEEEALAAVHNEKQGELIAADLRVLARSTGQRPTPYRVAKAWAARTIREGRVNDMTSRAAVQRYRRAAKLAGDKAMQAILDGMDDDAFKHKQAQMLNNALVDEATRMSDQVDKAVARLSKIASRATMKSVDQEYLERAHALLAQVDMKARSQRYLDRVQGFEAWAQEQAAAGVDVVVPPSFAASLGTTNWSRLTVDQLLGLDAAVEQIIHLGRLKQSLLDNQERREFEAVRGEALGQMGGMDQKPPSDLMEPSYWDGIKSRVASADAALLKMETVFDWLDQGKSDGVFNRIVFRPIAEAQHTEQEMMREYVTKVQDLTRALPKETVKRWRDKFSDPRLINRETGRPWILNRDQLIAIALNMGNASNRAKLTGGYGWNEAAVMDVLNDNLSPDEWSYVQSIWDTIESLWPKIEAMEKRVNGVAPEKVEAEPISTSAGVLRGGYYPVVYDPAKNVDAELNASKAGDLFENTYTRAATSRGFTKARTAVERPIWLNIGVIERHLSEVIHDVTHREAIMQADKFLSDRAIVEAVDRTLGPEVRRQFRPWLQHIANEWAYDRAGMAGWEKFIRAIRRNTTFVAMAFRVSTVMMQVAGFSDSTGTIGAKAMTHGLTTLARDWNGTMQFVLERSGEVRSRMDTLDRDIREAARRYAGQANMLSAAQRFGFMGIGWADRLVTVPTWIGAYDKALKAGKSEADAIYEADKAVRVSQGSGAAKDLAAVQRRRGLFDLFTMFYSYASGYYQRMRSLGRDVKRANASDIPNLLSRSFWLILMPTIAAELLAGRPPEDDEDETWAGWVFEKVALSMANPIPILRDVLPPAVAAAQDKPTFGYSLSPISKMGETMVNVARDIGNLVEGEDTKRATRNFLEAAGYVTGAVPGQIAQTSQFIVDVGYGEADPQDIGDWWEGLTKGRITE